MTSVTFLRRSHTVDNFKVWPSTLLALAFPLSNSLDQSELPGVRRAEILSVLIGYDHSIFNRGTFIHVDDNDASASIPKGLFDVLVNNNLMLRFDAHAPSKARLANIMHWIYKIWLNRRTFYGFPAGAGLFL